ncbi:hypothetical protein [Nocardioides marmorisolisilvae]|uniref:hypothetical protein n=1 Tax=Nocardioides marmorisolisilvae TaxID=1542737 RepID=UPI001C83B1D5|nr:hypothetical protein [Nocardioides marmorisolisilvae]
MVDSSPASTTNNPGVGTLFTSTVSCPAGRTLIGGGANITQGSAAKAAVSQSYASTPGVAGTWTAQAIITVNSNNNNMPTITAYAICAQ